MSQVGKFSIWHWLTLFFLIAFVGFLGNGLVVAILEKGVGSAEAAGWVQAIGTVLAIAGAFLVVDHQHRKERTLELERQRIADVRKLKAIKAVLVQVCHIAKTLHTMFEDVDHDSVYDFDPQFLADYKGIVRALPLFEIPSPQLAIQLTALPRAIEEVVVRLTQARELEDDSVTRVEWLLAHDIEKRIKALANLAIDANNRCIYEIEWLDGYTVEELTNLKVHASNNVPH